MVSLPSTSEGHADVGDDAEIHGHVDDGVVRLEMRLGEKVRGEDGQTRGALVVTQRLEERAKAALGVGLFGFDEFFEDVEQVDLHDIALFLVVKLIWWQERELQASKKGRWIFIDKNSKRTRAWLLKRYVRVKTSICCVTLSSSHLWAGLAFCSILVSSGTLLARSSHRRWYRVNVGGDT